MQLMVMISGEYTEAELEAARKHMSILRQLHPECGLDMIVPPNTASDRIIRAIAKPFDDQGYPLLKVSAREFTSYSINNLSSTIN